MATPIYDLFTRVSRAQSETLGYRELYRLVWGKPDEVQVQDPAGYNPPTQEAGRLLVLLGRALVNRFRYEQMVRDRASKGG